MGRAAAAGAPGGHDAGRDGGEPRDPADLAGPPHRPALRSRADRAASASARQARQPPLPDRQGARHVRTPGSARKGNLGGNPVRPRRERSGRPAAKLLLLATTYARRPASARLPTGPRGSGVRSTPDGGRYVHAAAILCRAFAADPVAARDADADRPRALRPPSGSTSTSSAGAMFPPTMPTSPPRRC